jgi:undecaprenyl diphosphate synthase
MGPRFRGGDGYLTMAADPAIALGGAPLPRHVAIIMDGNGRWAKKRHLPRLAGHKQGVEAVRRVSREARRLGIEALTLYAFSSENWRRPAEEVSDLMGLLRWFIRNDLAEIIRDNVRLRIIGDYRKFSPDTVAMIDDAMARTAGNTGPLLVIALNYGSQAELVGAAQELARRVRDGAMAVEAIDDNAIAGLLDTHDLPPLDLLIRTSGEQRLSNFLLWQAAYAELLFVDTLWPDFNEAALGEAVAAFGQRQRRFGGL